MKRLICWIVGMALVQTPLAYAAKDNKDKDKGKDVVVRAFVNDTCIIADEPFYTPAPPATAGDSEARAKFLPLLGLVVGKLAELYINNKIKNSADHYKAGYARKDTRYAVSSQMNLYRAEFEPVPALVLNASLGCMTIVAGTFKPAATDCSQAYVPKTLSPDSIGKPEEEWKTSRTDDSIANQLRRANICIEGDAKAVYEARFEFSKDGTAYRLKDAGYRVDSLLTTDAKGASRTTLYTLKISNPSATDQQEVLSSAWVNIGSVSAGAHSRGKGGDEAPWLKVPPLTAEARRNFDDKTKIPQQVSGEIEALQRALTRNQRMLTSMDQRIAAATTPDMVDGLKQERTRIAVQNQSQAAELDARKAEYHDLQLGVLEFMPVTIEVAVTETESEKAAQVALADIVGNNSDVVAGYVGTATTNLLSKSVSSSDLKIDEGSADAGDYERLRAQYFDALVAANLSQGSAAAPEAQRSLLAAKNKYNEARVSLGLEQIR